MYKTLKIKWCLKWGEGGIEGGADVPLFTTKSKTHIKKDTALRYGKLAVAFIRYNEKKWGNGFGTAAENRNF